MRWFRKHGKVCQNCAFGNNEKGKWIYKKLKRKNNWENGYWHIFCEKKKKYYFWDKFKRCFIRKEFKTSYDEIYDNN